METGFIGLGRMGSNLACNMHSKEGIQVYGYDVSQAIKQTAEAGICVTDSLRS